MDRISIEVYQGVNIIPKDVMMRLRLLTNGGWGRRDSAMFYYLNTEYNKHIKSIVTLSNNDVIIGWAMLFQCPMWYRTEMHVYVHRTCRKKGYGKMLVARCMEIIEGYDELTQPIVTPWDQGGLDFYRSVGLTEKQVLPQ